ncbi:MAG TPA: dihydrofolate reductase family protein [Acidimicrobiales bacterium]
MATVVAGLSMSLDGFIAHPDDSVRHLFDWYGNGEVEIHWPGNDMVSHVTLASATYLRDAIAKVGALVVGRRVFDYTQGWAGSHPFGAPVFVVSHSVPDGWPRADAPFTIVTDGVGSAVAQASEVAGDKTVGLAGPNIIQQCLNSGLLDELSIELVPVLLGEGIRFFDNLTISPIMFENPTVIEGDRVTHLVDRRSR